MTRVTLDNIMIFIFFTACFLAHIAALVPWLLDMCWTQSACQSASLSKAQMPSPKHVASRSADTIELVRTDVVKRQVATLSSYVRYHVTHKQTTYTLDIHTYIHTSTPSQSTSRRTNALSQTHQPFLHSPSRPQPPPALFAHFLKLILLRRSELDIKLRYALPLPLQFEFNPTQPNSKTF